MGEKLHNLISVFFKLFVPIVYVTFILAGLASAMVSAIIEYNVFAELFKVGNQGVGFLISIPFLVIFAFESTKIFLIFLNKQYSITENGAYVKDKKYFFGLRMVLILISVIATLIYSFYNLQNPEYDDVLTTSKNDVNIQYESDLIKLNSSYDKELEEQLSPIVDATKVYDGRMKTEENFTFGERQEYRGPRFKEAQKNKQKQENKREQIINTVNEKRRAAIRSLGKEKDAKIKNAENDLSTFSKAGNKMLIATLKIINLKNSFPEHQYVILVGLLSFLLSLGLEFIIWSSFTVLAMHHGDILDFGIQTQKFKNATEASLDIENAETENWVRKASHTAKTVTNVIKKKSKESIEQIKNEL